MATYTDAEMKQFMNKVVRAQGFNAWLNTTPLCFEGDELEFYVHVREDMCQHHGYVHGGILATLADNACAWIAAAQSRMDVVTSGLNVQYMAPAKGDELRVRARCIRVGKRIVTAEADVFCKTKGKDPVHSVHATASIAVLSPRT